MIMKYNIWFWVACEKALIQWQQYGTSCATLSNPEYRYILRLAYEFRKEIIVVNEPYHYSATPLLKELGWYASLKDTIFKE